MPFYRRRFYKRRYGATVRNMKMTRKFKASAANMTQNGLFNVSARSTLTFNVTSGTQSVVGGLDVANLILQADMHKQLSTVFDQYKISKVSIKIRPAVGTATPVSSGISYLTFFSCVDRTGFNAAVTLAQLRTYGSYKESSFSTTGDMSRPHYIAIGQSGIVSKSTYYDTKASAVFPSVYCGVDLGANVTNNSTFVFSVEIDAQVRYRGVRLDTGAVRTL